MKIERKVFLQILHCNINHFNQISTSLPGRTTWKSFPENDTLPQNPCYIFSAFEFETKVKGMFFLELCKFCPGGGRRGLSKVYTRRLCPKVNILSILRSLFPQNGLLFHVTSSLKPLSDIYSRPITSPFVDKLAMNV